MQNILVLILPIILFLGVPALTQPQLGGFNVRQADNMIKEALDQWIKFKQDNLKQFSSEEDIFRFGIFKENLKRIDEYRKKFQDGQIHFQVAINQFADLTKDEFVRNILKLKMPGGRFRRETVAGNRTIREVPQFMDWRNQGAVTPIKDQGHCASCWAFSAVGSIEGQHYLRTGKLVSLSEQNLIDCSVDQTNNGCSGGWMANAFQYLSSNSITTENEYSYVGAKRSCDNQIKKFRISIKGYQSISSDESSLQQAVASIGPVSVAMDASNLQFYAGGVYRDDECASGQVNHGLLVVGYGREQDRDYWVIKNSWGSKWGEGGYFKMIRNKGNQCSIASYGMYPIL